MGFTLATLLASPSTSQKCDFLAVCFFCLVGLVLFGWLEILVGFWFFGVFFFSPHSLVCLPTVLLEQQMDVVRLLCYLPPVALERDQLCNVCRSVSSVYMLLIESLESFCQGHGLLFRSVMSFESFTENIRQEHVQYYL